MFPGSKTCHDEYTCSLISLGSNPLHLNIMCMEEYCIEHIYFTGRVIAQIKYLREGQCYAVGIVESV